MRRAFALFEAAKMLIRTRAPDVNLTAEHLAQALGCSRAHLYRVFAEHGGTIGDALRDARMEIARSLLMLTPSLPVQQIAHRSGYASAAAFGRAFRTATGHTPIGYRMSLS